VPLLVRPSPALLPAAVSLSDSIFSLQDVNETQFILESFPMKQFCELRGKGRYVQAHALLRQWALDNLPFYDCEYVGASQLLPTSGIATELDYTAVRMVTLYYGASEGPLLFLSPLPLSLEPLTTKTNLIHLISTKSTNYNHLTTVHRHTFLRKAWPPLSPRLRWRLPLLHCELTILWYRRISL